MDTTGRGEALALAGAGIAAAASFSAVFDDWRFFPALAGAVVVPHLVGHVCRRRSLPAVLVPVMALAALALYAAWTVAPGTTAFGVPTPATLGELVDSWDQGWSVVRHDAVPVPVEPGVLLLSVIGVGLLSTAADTLAFTADATVGAAIPGVVLLTITGILGDDTGALAPAAVFCLSFAVFLALRHASLRERSRSWFLPSGHPRRWSMSRSLAFAAVAVLGALLLVPALPGSDADALFDYDGLLEDSGGGDLVAGNPVVDIHSNLLEFPDTVMFTADADAPYYRQATLDVFDGTSWTFSEQRFGDADPDSGFPGTGQAPTTEREFAITIEALRGSWLPAPYRPVDVDGLDAGTAPDRPDVFLEDGLAGGDTYTVRSEIPERLDAADLDSAGPTAGTGLDPYRDLPDDFPEPLRQKATEIVAAAGATTPYEMAVALRDWFRNQEGPERFVYDDTVEAGLGVDTIEQFVLLPVEEGGHTGYCEQFSTSMSALGRSLGLPTRVAVGYLSGERSEESGLYEIRGDRSHAWSEVYIDGTGWVPFDATPGNGAAEGVAGDHSVEPIGAGGQAPPPTGPPTGETPPSTVAPPQEPAVPDPAEGDDPGGVPAASPGATWTAPRVVAAVAAGVVLLVGGPCLAIVGIKRRRRSSRASRSETRDRIIGAWEETGERLAEAGIRPEPQDSPNDFARRAALTAGEAAPPLEHLAHHYTEACYSAAQPADESAREAWQDADAVARALDAEVSTGRRLRRRLDPRSLRRTHTPATP